MPADLIQAAEVLAAKRGTSINSLVQESLQKIVRSEDETVAAQARYQLSFWDGLILAAAKAAGAATMFSEDAPITMG